MLTLLDHIFVTQSADNLKELLHVQILGTCDNVNHLVKIIGFLLWC